LHAFIDGAVGFFKEVRAEVEKEPEQDHPEQPPKLLRRPVKSND
jgi:hypothetical protein